VEFVKQDVGGSILATQEAVIRRISVQSHPGQIVRETLSRTTLHKNRADGVTQGESPQFKPQYCKKNKTTKKGSLSNEFHFYSGL
jgi:hypothetical protein